MRDGNVVPKCSYFELPIASIASKAPGSILHTAGGSEKYKMCNDSKKRRCRHDDELIAPWSYLKDAVYQLLSVSRAADKDVAKIVVREEDFCPWLISYFARRGGCMLQRASWPRRALHRTVNFVFRSPHPS